MGILEFDYFLDLNNVPFNLDSRDVLEYPIEIMKKPLRFKLKYMGIINEYVIYYERIPWLRKEHLGK
mgnify:FL=1